MTTWATPMGSRERGRDWTALRAVFPQGRGWLLSRVAQGLVVDASGESTAVRAFSRTGAGK
ncbi:uncharacterized protein PHACADRAFT_169329 [Phanerochaete carnosa HHB-10118-sp]|uniref:Uncharacterized protein n=1 Tax=Phanerochaete carnosa (strain HHB-10118-sp) TaxID=650164 RepID=K5WHH7_PHACS|nr:uncharacterized protein PHACADRAFT_169329 [Phanerochaete carnosa HHB-10118-sp]EKM58780.1 hypothetical protein PHACADRAFT_169329 [Phanerochaete carnosa HHB-10118-sp]